MVLRLLWRVSGAIVLLAAAWSVTKVPDSPLRDWIHPVGGPHGPVRITRFYATTGSIALGGKAKLCYGVENAKSVRISPAIAQVFPTYNRCLEIVPDHTTNYIILAVGFDGKIDIRTLALVVETGPEPRKDRVNLAAVRRAKIRVRAARPLV